MALNRMGLTAEQERIYRRLLREHGLDEAPTPAERAVLAELRTLGLVRDDLTPESPAAAVEMLMHRRLAEAQRQLAGLSAAWDALRELDAEHRTGNPVRAVEFLPTPADSARRIHERPLSATELRVLQALTCHDTDETAARSMNVSVRKFRTHVAAAMDRLGARTRFQAALLAKEKGWL
ncbi:LuxR C-terminal-related transcriptional regulator [Nocardia amikacinitolerans]|uniref:helix-turn-helix transcriptional regulator n=1 Tax=Nocardia amikacinitolerans TaxID=756689 RepID=UPI0036C2CB1D